MSGPVLIDLGRKDDRPVQVDLAEIGGLQVVGSGGERAERALLIQALDRTRAGGCRLLVVRDDLCRLLGDQAGQRIEGAAIPGLRLEATADDALTCLGSELAGRLSQAQDPETSPADLAQIVPLICFLDPTDQSARILADLRSGRNLAVGAVVLGDWPHGVTLTVDDSGLTVDATGPHATDLIEIRMDLADEPVTDEQIASAVDIEPLGQPLLNTRRPATPVSPPRVQVDDVQATPGIVRLLGQYNVEGLTRRAGGRAKDVWALLGLLAENRTTLVTRSGIESKLWPDIRACQTRSATALRDTRAKLCEALGRPSNEGRLMIENVGSNGYRINPDLFTCDIWRLRDQLAHAATPNPEEKAAALAAAVDLYTGPYLPESPYGWAQTAARKTARDIVQALVQLAGMETTPEHAAAHLERATQIDPNAEHLYRDRMNHYAALGKSEAIHHCYDQLTEHVKVHGRRPEAQTQRLYRRLTGIA